MKHIQFITHTNNRYSYTDGARMALEGGCRWIQLRMKDATDDELRHTAVSIHYMCRQHRATFIIDDRVHIAKELYADGVHLGRNDMPIAEARQVLGKNFIIGGTANTFEDIERLWKEGADYIGCGPFRFTTTKAKLSPIIGLDGYRYIIQRMRKANINLPVMAIGGIMLNDVQSIMNTGVDGIAISGAILNATEPVVEMQHFIKILLTNNQQARQ